MKVNSFSVCMFVSVSVCLCGVCVWGVCVYVCVCESMCGGACVRVCVFSINLLLFILETMHRC